MPRNLRTWMEILLVTALYVCAGKAGLSMAFFNASASPIWPPTGLSLAILLIWGGRFWPAIFAGAFILNFSTRHGPGISTMAWLFSSIAIASGNTLEAVLSAALARTFARGTRAFERVGDLVRYVGIAALAGTALSALVGALSLCLVGAARWADFHPVWTTWWTGDFVSDLLVAPLLIMAFTWPVPRLTHRRAFEAAIMALATGILSWLSFGQRTPPTIALANFLLPLLLLASFRFQQWGALLSAGIMSIIATIGTIRGTGPFVNGDPNTALLLLQAFVGIRMLTAMGLAAVVGERLLERQAKEEALASERKARAEAEQANRAKDEFLAVLSHELRTPLTPVLLTAMLLEKEPDLPEWVRADIRTIRENTALEARLIDDLLDISRITRGKMKLDMQAVDIHQTLSRSVHICFTDRIADLTLNFDAGLHHVFGDPARLQQIFWNLFNNAVKFTPAGRTIRVRTSNPNEATLRVEVLDAGVGIDPRDLPRMFEAFEQGDSGNARRTGGLGLGLAITRALVEAHNGRMTAHSDGHDKGASFSVELALHLPPIGESRQVNGFTHPRAEAALRVLLVEDHEATRVAMVRLLESLGHQVTAAGTALDALASVNTTTVDLVISDIGLPDVDGLELMRRLRPLFAQRGLPVRAIAVTGYGMEQDLLASREAGFDAHLIKPVSLDGLAVAISRATR